MDTGIIIFLVLLMAFATLKLLFAMLTGLCSFVTGGALFTVTHPSKIERILQTVPMRPGQVVYDLGCGDGRFLVAAYQRYRVRAIGYEINPWAYVLARILIWLKQPPVAVHYKDFWKADLKDADVIFCYLFPDVMDKLRAKLSRELRVGTRVISCNFSVPGWKSDEVVRANHPIHTDPIYIYTFGT